MAQQLPKRGFTQNPTPTYDNQDVEDDKPSNPKVTVQANLDTVRGKARRYVEIRDQVKALTDDKDKLSEYLKSQAVSQGVKDGRSYVLELGDVTVKSLSVVKNVIDQVAAIKLLTAKKLMERCTMRVLDEAELAKCFQEGLIDMDEINKFTKEKITDRIDVTTPK